MSASNSLGAAAPPTREARDDDDSQTPTAGGGPGPRPVVGAATGNAAPLTFARKRKRLGGAGAPTAQIALAAPLPPAAPERQFMQLHLDFGQRERYMSRCHACGMLYARGTAADDRLHAAFHANALRGPRYQGLAGERVVDVDGSHGRVLLVSGGGDQCPKALVELGGFIEEQMALPRGWLLRVPLTLLLYVSATRCIQACVATEAIRGSIPARPSPPISEQRCTDGGRPAALAASNTGDAGNHGRAAACAACDAGNHGTDHQGQSKSGVGGQRRNCTAAAAVDGPAVLEHMQAACGVRLIWVSPEVRRRGLATRLLDCCRCQFMPGYILPRQELVFSAPTEAGRAFIETYTGSCQFLVYQ